MNINVDVYQNPSEDLHKKNYIELYKCKLCKNHIGMAGSFIYCSFPKEFNVTLLSAPSHYVKGFKNGVYIVNCYKSL